MSNDETTSVTDVHVDVPMKSDVPTFDAWRDDQSFEYTRIQSEVVDYINGVVAYETLDEHLVSMAEKNADTIVSADEIEIHIDNINSVLATLDIARDTDSSLMAESHLMQFILARVTYHANAS
jgi:hypothetical protein